MHCKDMQSISLRGSVIQPIISKHWQTQQVSPMQEFFTLPMYLSHVIHQRSCCSTWLKIRGVEESGVECHRVKWRRVDQSVVQWRGRDWRVLEWPNEELHGGAQSRVDWCIVHQRRVLQNIVVQSAMTVSTVALNSAEYNVVLQNAMLQIRVVDSRLEWCIVEWSGVECSGVEWCRVAQS